MKLINLTMQKHNKQVLGSVVRIDKYADELLFSTIQFLDPNKKHNNELIGILLNGIVEYLYNESYLSFSSMYTTYYMYAIDSTIFIYIANCTFDKQEFITLINKTINSIKNSLPHTSEISLSTAFDDFVTLIYTLKDVDPSSTEFWELITESGVFENLDNQNVTTEKTNHQNISTNHYIQIICNSFQEVLQIASILSNIYHPNNCFIKQNNKYIVLLQLSKELYSLYDFGEISHITSSQYVYHLEHADVITPLSLYQNIKLYE